MINNYLKIAYRNLSRQRLFTIINITGLATVLACAIIISLYVSFEKSYDRFHKNYNRIYRICITGKVENNEFKGPVSPSPLAKTLVSEFPEIESVVRLFPAENTCIQANNKTNYEEKFLYADSSFFDIFTFNFLQGEASSLLKDSNSVVIDQSTAIKYFGNSKAIGEKILVINGDSNILTITGIIEDMPVNSHFHFNFICNSRILRDAENPYWINTNNYTYIVLKEGYEYKKTENKLANLVRKYVMPQIQQFYPGNSNISKTFQYNFHLQNITDIHLSSNQDYELEPPGNNNYISIFIVVAIFLIIIACINFINLSTASSINRSKEIGIRKTMGASRSQIIYQFFIETVLICMFAVLIALFFCELFLPILNNALGLHLTIKISERVVIYIIITITLIISFLAGSSPALYLSGFRPVEVVKNEQKKIRSNVWGSALVILQFTISISLILCTLVIYNQIKYIQNKNLGYETEKIIVIEKTDPIKKQLKNFLGDLKNTPLIQDLAISSNIPGRAYFNSSFLLNGAKEKPAYYFSFLFADYSYINVMGLKIVNGRYFSKNEKTDSNAIVINESSVKYLGIKNPVGQILISPAPDESKMNQLKIIGVVSDFHYEDLHKPIKPVILMLSNNITSDYISVKIPEGRKNEAINYINAVWKKYTSDVPLKYTILNKEFAKLYKSEYNIKFTMTIFSLIAIFIASLGLFALVAYNTEKRTKEIGIRKALGSSVFKIIALFTMKTIYLVIIASAISIVISWYFMTLWLNSYAYHVELNLAAFVGTCILALIIAVLAVFFQAYSAAVKNPVEAIRYE